jgi:hypothetical protein
MRLRLRSNSTGEWFDGGFYNSLGELKTRWQGRFSHYGYTYEYAKLESYAWSATNVGGMNSVRLSAPCTEKDDAPEPDCLSGVVVGTDIREGLDRQSGSCGGDNPYETPECQANRHYDYCPLPAKRMVSFR